MRDLEVSRYRSPVPDQEDLVCNQQQNQLILSSETLLIVEQLFTDLFQVQQRKQQMQEKHRILSLETLLFVEHLVTDILQVQQRK